MAALTADKPRAYGSGVEPTFNSLPVLTAVTIFEGSAVGESASTGTYRALVAADNFVGFAHENVVNPSGGTKRVKVRTKGIIRLAVTGVSAVAQHGDPVYAAADDTFTTASTGNTQIGKVYQWIVGSTCDVYFEGLTTRSI